MMNQTVTKTLSIEAHPARLLSFISEPANWPNWESFGVTLLSPSGKDSWAIDTSAGAGVLQIRRNPAVGLLAHNFQVARVPGAVSSRVLANGTGSELVVTLLAPPVLRQHQFAQILVSLDREMTWLRKLMELK